MLPLIPTVPVLKNTFILCGKKSLVQNEIIQADLSTSQSSGFSVECIICKLRTEA